VSYIPPIPELEVLAVNIFLFLMLLFALFGLLVREWYRLKRKWIAERRRTAEFKASRAPYPS
jgi:hypothetical protein